jgi:hypothetical protein
MKPEWMPVNPHPKEIHPIQCGSIRYYEGKRDGFDEGSIATAKAILEYLMADYQAFINSSPLPQQSVNRMMGQLESMLKQLEAK